MRQQAPTAADLVERLIQFDGPPQDFLRYLLAVQCRLAAAEAGVILRPGQDGDLQILTIVPTPDHPGQPPAWVGQAAEAAPKALTTGKTAIVPVHSSTDMYGTAPQNFLILVPLKHTGRSEVRGLSAFLMETQDVRTLRQSQERLELSAALLSLYEMQLMLQHRQADMRRLRDSLEVVTAVNRFDRFTSAAIALCNEFAARWQASRVSLGFLQGRAVKLRAISHTENFSRKMQLVQDLEAAMEECFDQDVEIILPSSPEATFVSRAANRLSERHGPSNVCSFPLRHGGEVKAVLTVERPRETPLDDESVESMRLAADMVTARLENLHENDRWAGAKAALALKKGAAALVGPKHTWIKLLLIAGLALGGFLLFAKGDYTVQAPFIVQARLQHRVPAPFDGRIRDVKVELADAVKKGQELASLDTDELETQLSSAQAEKATKDKAYDSARSEGKTVDAQIAQAQAAQAQARILLLQDRIHRAVLRAPIDGVVVVGDLKRQIGAPVKTGDVMFEVCPAKDLRAELAVDEKDIHELKPGQEGKLATVSAPDVRLPFRIESINPAAETEEKANTFKVRVSLLTEAANQMLPGMKGVAHVDVDRRHYAWIWTHSVIDWVRLKLWI